MKHAILGILVLLPVMTAFGQEYLIDLNDQPAYVRAGFSEDDLTRVPSPEGGWVVVPGTQAGERPIRIADLGLPGIDRRRPLSFSPPDEKEFTILLPFVLDETTYRAMDQTQGGQVPGIHLAALADNWTIYVNGVAVRSEVHLDESGRITSHRGYRNVFVPIDSGLLRGGVNILGLRIIGDGGQEFTGLRLPGPHRIAPYEWIRDRTVRYIDLVLIGLYAFVGLYHLFIAAVRRTERHYLYYALFSIAVAAYSFSRSHVMPWIVADYYLITRIELISLYTLIPFIGAFMDALDGHRMSTVTSVYGWFSVALMAVSAITPVPFALDLLRLWQITALGMAVYYIGWRLVRPFVLHSVGTYRRLQADGAGPSLTAVYVREILKTPRGNLLLGGIVLFVTAVYDILDAAIFHRDVLLTKYGFFLFTMGTALILANRFQFLHERVQGLSDSLDGSMADLAQTSDELAASERRYRSLFEGVSEPVAVLDRQLRFTDANPAARRLFNLRPDTPCTLDSCLFDSERKDLLELAQVHQAASSAWGSRDPVDLSIRIRSSVGEPMTIRVRMQQIRGRELLLRVHPDEHDEIMRHFEKGSESFRIDSRLSMAGQISRRAVAPLNRYLDRGQTEFLAMCLNEIVINAVEHGNLEVTFEEKSEALRRERYFEFLVERQKDPRFCDRQVRVEWSISPETAVFRVTDEGPGFDHRSFLANLDDPSRQTLEHGRGLMMAINAFDSVLYNEKGNQVRLVKALTGSRA